MTLKGFISGYGRGEIKVMWRRVAAIAVPAVVSNISVPLLSLVDTAITGHLGSPDYIGAVAVGAMIFNVLYWLMGFLRMSTSGLTSQAFGAGDSRGISLSFSRSLLLGLAIGLLFVVLSPAVGHAAFSLVHCPEGVRSPAETYFDICILGAPAVLGMYALSGWFIGMQNSRYPMYASVVQNVINIIVSLVAVYVFRLGISGVAAGTVVGEYGALLLCLVMWRRKYAPAMPRIPLRTLLKEGGLVRFFSVNRDIFLRSLFLVAVMTCFTAFGASLGSSDLAANALLMQLFTIFSYVSDALAYASEALSGRYIGARDMRSFRLMTGLCAALCAAMAMLFTVAYFLCGSFFFSLLTDSVPTVASAMRYLPFAAVIPLLSAPAFLLDGIFVGATASRLMLTASAVSAAAFFLSYAILPASGGNFALWASFLCYLLVRSLMMFITYPRMRKQAFAL